jgi:hypothetical protein
LTSEELRRLARLGAAKRLEELRREEAALRAAFPGLGSVGAARGRRQARAANRATAKKRRRRKMSAAQKRAVSQRMKKYWAERRKAR